MKVALVYDRVNKWGGAERVLLSLHELFPEAPLYTSLYSPQKATWADVFPKVIPSNLQKLPFIKNKHELIPYLMPQAFEGFNFNKFDLVITVTSESAKGIITTPSTNHICYMLTPTRYLWSGYKGYFNNKILKHVSKPVVRYLRNWDKIAAQRPDKIVSISKVVQQRVKRYYKRKSNIIYPPVDVQFFKPNKKVLKDKYYLIVSRLVPYKKVDLAIHACNKLKVPLIVIGSGSEEKKLKNIAGKSIHFVKNINDQQLKEYYQKARALIFPQIEDFGLVAVESISAGTPVIALKKGGSIDIVKEGKSGVFFDKQTPEALKYAIERFSKKDFDAKVMESTIKKFSEERFKAKFVKTLHL